MESLTKTELSWIIGVLREESDRLRSVAVETSDARLPALRQNSLLQYHSSLCALKSEQLSGLADRLENVIKNNGHRISVL